jgi:putative ABC transport system permease protein
MKNVRAVLPMKVVVSNCRASLDVVTFRGVPRDSAPDKVISGGTVIEGSVEEWRGRSDAALLGSVLARRRGLRHGDQFQSAGVTAYVAGVFESDEPQDQNVAYVHLDFLQQAVDRRLGIVTQFTVQVEAPEYLDTVAAEIDALFAPAESPTTTRPEKAFVAQAAADMISLVSFGRFLGWGCLLAVLALIGNAIVLSVQGRVRDHAVLQTLGYHSGLIGRMVVAEGVLLGVIGGGAGTLAAIVAVRWTQFSLSVDGLSIPIQANIQLAITGVVVSATLGILSGLVPAWQVSRREIATCFRAV